MAFGKSLGASLHIVGEEPCIVRGIVAITPSSIAPCAVDACHWLAIAAGIEIGCDVLIAIGIGIIGFAMTTGTIISLSLKAELACWQHGCLPNVKRAVPELKCIIFGLLTACVAAPCPSFCGIAVKARVCDIMTGDVYPFLCICRERCHHNYRC